MISCIFVAFLIGMDVVDAYKPMKYVGEQYCASDKEKECTTVTSRLPWSSHSDNKRVCLETCQNADYNSYTYSERDKMGYCERGDYNVGYNTDGKRCGSGDIYGTSIVTSSTQDKYQAYCPKGKYHSSKNGCSSCGAGKYNPSDDYQLSACYDCPNGKYSNGNGRESCTDCPVARYQSSAGKSWCNICPKGKYNYRKGRANCDDCMAGRYGDQMGVTNWQEGCKLCQTGKYQELNNNGKIRCKSCEPGKYNGNTGRSTCVQCSTGKYQADTNAGACNNCVPGQYQNTPGQTVCKTCPKGYMGSTLGLSYCDICPNGEFQDQDSQTSCKKCPANFFRQDLISVSCATCPEGTTSEAGSESCCEPGTFSVASKASSDIAACHTCAAGYYAPTFPYYNPISDVGQRIKTSSSLTTSGKTTYFAQCATCAYGYYQDEEGQNSCKQCPSGKFTNPYGVFGTVDDNWRDTSCRARCDIKVAAKRTESSYFECGPGLFWDLNDAICPSSTTQTCSDMSGNCGYCILCSPGFYKVSRNTGSNCVKAPPGWVVPMLGSAESIVRLCNGGDYQNQERQSSCKKCPIGYYGNSELLGSEKPTRFVNRNCLACPTGKWSSTYFEDETPVLSDTDWETAFTYLGAGQCRGVGGMSPAWGVKETADHESARKECLNDESCVAYTRLVDDTFKYFCSKVGDLCTEFADESDAYTTIAGDFTSTPSVSSQCPDGFIFNEDSIRCEVDLSHDFGVNGTSVCYGIERRMSDVVGGCKMNSVTNMEECGQWIGDTPWESIDREKQNEACGAEGSGHFDIGEDECRQYYEENTGTGWSFVSTTSNEYPRGCTGSIDEVPLQYTWRDPSGPAGLAGSLGENVWICGVPASPSGLCKTCPKGYFSDTPVATRRSECRMCPSGYFSENDGATFCSACPEGTYSSDTGAIDSDTCKNCPVGYFQDETGANERKACTICAEGRFSPYEAQPNIFACILCPHGFYSSEAGSAFCEKCSDTSITDDVGSVDDTYCKECPLGKFNIQAQECIQCPKGWFKDSDTCRECPVGKMSRVHDADACEDCDYQDESGRDRCKLCPMSSYVKNNVCLECPSGQFAETFNAVTCVSCPEGRYIATQSTDSAANCVRCPSVSMACYGDLVHIDTNTNRKTREDLCKEAARDVYNITDKFETRADKNSPYGCFVEDSVLAVLNLYTEDRPQVFDKANTLGLCHLNGQAVAARAGTCSGMSGGPTRVVEENQLFGGAVYTLSKDDTRVALDWHPLYSVKSGDACPIGKRGSAPNCVNCVPGKYSRMFDKTATGILKSYMEASRIGVSVKDYMYGATISATGVNLETATNNVLASVPSISWNSRHNGWVTHISDTDPNYKYSTFDWTLTQCLDMCQKNSNCKAASWAPSTIDAAYVDKHKDAAELWSINTFQVRGVGSRSITKIQLVESETSDYVNPCSAPCRECRGDCDSDADCEDGLKCFQRVSDGPVPPGCTGAQVLSDNDYCYDPKKNYLINWSPGWSHASRNETSSRSWGAPAYINSQPNVFHSLKDSTLTRVRKRLHNWKREQKLNNTVVETDDVTVPDVADLDNDWWRDAHGTGTEPVDEWLNLDRHINNVLPDGTYSNYMVPRNFFVGENLEPTFFDSSEARESLQPKYGTCFLSNSLPVKDMVYVIYQENTATSDTWSGTIKGLEPDASYTVEWDVLMSGLSGGDQKVNTVTMNGKSLGGCNLTYPSACDFVTCPENGAETYSVTADALGEIHVEATYQFHNAECSCDRDIQYGRCVPRILELDGYTITRAALRFRLASGTTLHPGFWLSCQRYGKTILVDENAGLSCRAHLVHTYVKEACISCPAGKFSEDPASPSCKDCPQGWHSEMGSHRCTLCPLCPSGKIQTSNCECEFCPAGQELIIDVGCKACAPGKYAMYGTSECKECAPGRKAPSAGTGTPCEACRCDIGHKIVSLEQHTDRTTCNQIQCQECEAGHYQDVINHLTQCKPCGPHQYQSETGQDSCQSCAPSCTRSCVKFRATCSNAYFDGCSRDTMSCSGDGARYAPGDRRCDERPNVLASDSRRFYSYTTGYCECENGRKVYITCAMSKFRYMETCAQRCAKDPGDGCICNVGKTRRQLAKTASDACDNSDSCSDCATGHYCSSDVSIERECPRGRYQNEAAKTSCKECPIGRYSAVGKTECTLCDPGKSSESGSGYPEHCLYCPADAIEVNRVCTACPQGRINIPGTNTCECQSGYFESNEYCAQWPTHIKFNNEGRISHYQSPLETTSSSAYNWLTYPLTAVTSAQVQYVLCRRTGGTVVFGKLSTCTYEDDDYGFPIYGSTRNQYGYVTISRESRELFVYHSIQKTTSTTTVRGIKDKRSDVFQFTCAADLEFDVDTVTCQLHASYFVPPSE